MKQVALLAVSTLLLAAPAFSKQAITHEDLWLMPRVGPALVSPDGRQAIVPVTEPAYDPAQQRVDLWLLDVANQAAPRRLTHTLAPETTPAWSADSKRIAFATQRDGDSVAQIYVLDLAAGGEARRISSMTSAARNPQFSPDGLAVLFVSQVDTTSETDRTARGKSTARVFDGFPIRFWDKWLGPNQLRVFYQSLDTPEARDLLAGSTLVQSPGYGGRSGEASDEIDATFSPDGQSVLFVASQNRHLGASQFTNTNLYRVSVLGGEPERLTGVAGTGATDNYSRPRFSPDGLHLLAAVEPRTDRVYNATRLDVFRASGQFLRRLEAPNGASIGAFDVGADNHTVFLSIEGAGQEQIWQQPLAGGTAKPLTQVPRGTYSNLSVARGGKQAVLLAGYESASVPAEIVRIDPKRGSHETLSRFSTDRAAKLDLPELVPFWHEHAGRPIHSLLVKPAGFDPARRYPVFALIHGGPHIMWRDQFFLRWNYHLLAGKDRVLILTNYRGSTGFGEAFAQAIQNDPLIGPAEDINTAVDAALKQFDFLDGSRQCAGGASYGGHLSNWLQASTTRYRCLVSHAGLINLESQWTTSDSVYGREANMGGPAFKDRTLWDQQNPIRRVEQFKTPVLVTIGELDYRVPINNTLEYWSMLKRQGIESRLIVFPDENHWILKGENSRFFYREVDSWLNRWLGPQPSAR
ncbi:prolyl oligopeptidase [Ahniella affigens]|uniref:Prolyl oligopeptidase n=1 Tax=Ahniella affigens TaxID=2021234 RepID=A0A2P1PNE1_9GAMM|nr:S9 family peptidase [Ahniella affigens]AVP96374.1 prolyl oligopeptidase [Ahniella affigens]